MLAQETPTAPESGTLTRDSDTDRSRLCFTRAPHPRVCAALKAHGWFWHARERVWEHPVPGARPPPRVPYVEAVGGVAAPVAAGPGRLKVCTFVHANGSPGAPPTSVARLLELMELHPLAPATQVRRLDAALPILELRGSFFGLPHAFHVSTNDEELVRALLRGVRANRRRFPRA